MYYDYSKYIPIQRPLDLYSVTLLNPLLFLFPLFQNGGFSEENDFLSLHRFLCIS